MAPPSSNYKPPGWNSLTPRLFASDPAALVSDNSIREASPAFLYVYVADTNATYTKALAAGAQSVEPPVDLPYGDRRCMVRDHWGNTWQIATHLETLTPEEIARRMQAASY